MERHFIPTAANNAVDAFGELFKNHIVFNPNCDNDLENFYHFVEFVFYGLNSNIILTPTMREIRRKLLVENVMYLKYFG